MDLQFTQSKQEDRILFPSLTLSHNEMININEEAASNNVLT